MSHASPTTLLALLSAVFNIGDTEGEGTGEVAIDVNTPPGFSKPAEK